MLKPSKNCLSSSLIIDPNPSKGEITINVKRNHISNDSERSKISNRFLTIHNAFGEEVFRKSNILDDLINLNIEFLSNGIYFVKYNTGNMNYIERIVKL